MVAATEAGVAEVAEVVVATATTARQAARTVVAAGVATVVGEEVLEDHLMVVVMAEAEIAMEMADPAGGEKKNLLQDSTQPSSFTCPSNAVLQAYYYRSGLA